MKTLDCPRDIYLAMEHAEAILANLDFDQALSLISRLTFNRVLERPDLATEIADSLSLHILSALQDVAELAK